MLESNSFAIERTGKSGKAKLVQEIRDANTGDLIGVAREESGFFTRSLRSLLGTSWLLRYMEVREKPDDSLVFILRKNWDLFGSRWEVRDAMETLVGHLKCRFSTVDARLVIYDKVGKDVAVLELTPDSLLGSSSFLDGSKSLATISRSDRDDNLLLQVNPELTDQPLVKMLLLAATLSVARRMLTGAIS